MKHSVLPIIISCLATGIMALPSLADDAIPMANAGFEDGLKSWIPSPEDAAIGASQISTEAAHTGQSGLRVKLDAPGKGSWIQGPKVPVAGAKGYRLSFWARTVQDSGIGVWVNFSDAQGKNITLPAQISVQIPRNVPKWTEYHLDFKAPYGAASFTAAVHAYSNSACLADFDDFTVAPIDLAAIPAPPPPAPIPMAKRNLITPPDPARVKEIATFLDAKPQGLNFTLDNRAPWQALAADVQGPLLITRAEKFLNEPIPEVSEAAYDAAVQSGARDNNAPIDRRRFRLVTFVLAEGMENKGRFLPAIEKELVAICSEKSWIIAAHVKFTGKNDLGSAMTSWTVSTAVSMLGDRLSEPTRKLVKDTVMSRVVQPYLEQMRDATSNSDFWRNSPFNWNAVVHGGIVGAALALDDSLEERAELIAAAEKETQFYINGFPVDGYSTEGMGYWKYGFGHYVMLSEAVLKATHGKINLYDQENIRKVAQFPRRFEIAPDVFPAYSDAQFKEEPTPWLNYMLDVRYGLGDGAPRSFSMGGMFSAFLYAYSINLAFDPKATPPAQTASISKGHRARDWFDISQIYVGRPAVAGQGLGFSFKGGNNGTSHGHDDIGSYVVVMDNKPLIVDPGATVYDARTFGPHRYDIQVINSYGHDVPRVGGKLQGTGTKYAAAVTETKFADSADSATLDLTKGYDLPDLSSLKRTYDYSREGKGSVTVTDRAEFKTPQAFGTALSTFGEAKEETPGVWVISQDGKAVRATIDAGGAPFTVTNEVLTDAAAAGKVRRLGIDLNAPADKAVITVKITPIG